MANLIQIRRDPAAIWTAVNPILAEGEMGFETDTGKLKIGNGVDLWNVLPYMSGGSGGGGGVGPTGATGTTLEIDLNSSLVTAEASALNFTGAGVTATLNGNKVDVYIPGASAQVNVGAKQTINFTLTSGMLSSLIPVGGGVNVNIDLSSVTNIAVGYSVILSQDDATPFGITFSPGVTVHAPNGLISVGQYTTCALIQTATDVWLLTIAGAGTGGGGSGGVTNAFEVLAPSNQAGVVLFGGGNGTGTFVQANNVYTVTLVGHGLTAAMHNGMDVVVPRNWGDPSMFNWGAAYYDVGTNFQYIDADHFSMTVTSSSSNSGSVGQTNQYYKYPLRRFLISANSVGANGTLRVTSGISQNGTSSPGHDKTLYCQFGDDSPLAIGMGDVSGDSVSAGQLVLFQNMNNPAKQAWRYGYGQSYSGGGNTNYITTDTAVDQTLTIAGQLESTADWLVLDYALVERFKKT